MITPVDPILEIQSAIRLNSSVQVPSSAKTAFGRDLVTFSPLGMALSQSRARGGMPEEWSDTWSPDKINLSLFRGTMDSYQGVFQKYTGSSVFNETLQGLSGLSNRKPSGNDSTLHKLFQTQNKNLFSYIA
ncbi:MAG: hypothetical protein H7833_03495 [Magnetococcus sp. DMHC-1]|nr:hypothetical protein [Magnetococcales bacterium]